MPNLKATLIMVTTFAIALGVATVTRTEEIPKRAPYDAVRWDEDTPVVRIGDAWQALVSIDGVATDEIVAYCQQAYDAKWRKRFEEDLVEVLLGMDQTPGDRVSLVVRDPETSETKTLQGVAMTRANRQEIWRAAQAQSGDKSAAPFARLAPYKAVRWEGDTPQVVVEAEWLGLVSVNRIATDEIVGYCKRTYDAKWRKRFEEDLVEVLLGMGQTPGAAVELVVQDPDSSETQTLEDVPMTRENRQAIWRAAQRRERPQQADAPADARS